MWFENENDTDSDVVPVMAPKQKGGQKPKANTADEVEETFQAVVCFAVAQTARLPAGQSFYSYLVTDVD